MLFQSENEQGTASPFPWYAIRVRSNREHIVAVHLRDRGFQEYSPSYTVTSQWADRKKIIDKFLFPGYVFCRLDTSHRLPVLSAPGVVGIVGCGKIPVPIPECEMDRVRAMMNSGLPVMPWPYLATGDFVLIEKGPLAGVEGILQSVKGKHRIVVSFSLLQRSVSAEIDRVWVRPLNKSTAGESERVFGTCGIVGSK
jgi:transcription antitermination factor NusG